MITSVYKNLIYRKLIEDKHVVILRGYNCVIMSFYKQMSFFVIYLKFHLHNLHVLLHQLFIDVLKIMPRFCLICVDCL